MGRIKSRLAKRLGNELLEKYPESFTATFDDNKKAMPQYVEITSKKIRNTVAGHITRQVRNKKTY